MEKKLVILCVDDSSSILEGRRMLLEAKGYTVLTATNGREAVEVFIAQPVDLVLMDYHMPEMNGDAAARQMKALKPDIPIALLSGDELLPERALEPVDAFISKSEPIVSFLEQVDYLLSLRLMFLPFEALVPGYKKKRAIT